MYFARYSIIYMDFQLTEEQIAVQLAARDFARNELLPGVIERDELQKFPKEQIKKLAELGFMGMMVDPKYGGSGMDTISYVLAMEEIFNTFGTWYERWRIIHWRIFIERTRSW